MNKLPNSKMIEKMEMLPQEKKKKGEPKRNLKKLNQFMTNFANTFHMNNMSDVLELFLQLVYKQELSVEKKMGCICLFFSSRTFTNL